MQYNNVMCTKTLNYIKANKNSQLFNFTVSDIDNFAQLHVCSDIKAIIIEYAHLK